MLAIDKKILTCNTKDIHFSDYPYDTEGCDALKFHYCEKKVNVNGFTRQEEFTSIIDLTQDLETILQNMNKNTRYCIKRAQVEGIVVRINEDYEQFFQIYRSFIQKKGIKSLFEVFGVGTTTLEAMKRYGTLFVAEYDSEILGGSLFLENKSSIKAWISASKRLEVDKNKRRLIGYANRLIDWEAIKYAKEKGMKEFDHGGLWPEREAEENKKKKGINSFKLSFGGKIVTRYSYYKIYSKCLASIYYAYNLKDLVKKQLKGKEMKYKFPDMTRIKRRAKQCKYEK